jgi:hypothetical protein
MPRRRSTRRGSALPLVGLLLAGAGVAAAAIILSRRKQPMPSPSQPVLTLDGVTVYREGSALRWEGDMSIDADGSPYAYHPDDWGSLGGKAPKGLDAPENGGDRGKGSYWGIATREGKPIVQGAGDPAPGYYVSTTALANRTLPAGNPRRYVDSAIVPYIAIPPELMQLGVKVGDLVRVSAQGRRTWAQVGDVGPRRKIGEGSIALAVALDLPLSERLLRSEAAQKLGLSGYKGRGTRARGITYAIFPGTSPGRPLTAAQLQAEGARLEAAA